MRSIVKPLIDISGMICQIDTREDVCHAICRIRYIEHDIGDFKYIFTPNYAEIDEIGEASFDGIPGLDLTRRQSCYTRTNRTPVFISERVPADNREDVRQLMMQDGMEGKSKLEWLMNTKTRYSGDRLIVRPLFLEEQRNQSVFVSTSVAEIGLSSEEYSTKYALPSEEDCAAGFEKKSIQRRGRPSKKIDSNLWNKVSIRYLNGEISAKEASGMLEISESTLFRRLRSEKKEGHKNIGGYGKTKGRYANRGDEANRSHAFGARFEAAQAEIDKLDGAEFQRLCTRYVRDKYRLDGLTALGMKAGTYGTTQGTPDAFWEYPDGSFLAMEAGHCNSSRSAAKKKILNDIKKCLDYEEEYLETGYIKRIVVCYSFSRFAMGDFKEIYDTFPKRDIDLVGPDELAIAVVEDFPWIGREMLNISYKSHAVMTITDFIEMHKGSSYRAPLDLDLVGREEELECARTLLKENQVVVLAGDSGAGKTRLAIEIVQTYGSSINSLPIVVQSTKEDISEELMLCCKKDQERIILLDDANELSRLSFLPGFLRENAKVKVVATVRSYAFETVKKEFQDTEMAVLRLKRFQEDGFNSVLETALQISSPVMRKAVADQSRGNLRLAYFICRTYAKGIPEGVSFGEIIKECYNIATEWLSENEKNAIRVSSILGAHRTFDNEDLDTLLERVGISHQTYIQACIKLCEQEMMDSVQSVKAVSFEEQNLRDYFIYDGLIVSQIFSLSDIWVLSRGERLLFNAVNILLQVFPDEKTIDIVKQQLASIWNDAKFSQKKDLVIRYSSLLGSRGLRFLLDQAESLPSLEQEPTEYRRILEEGNGSYDVWILKPLLDFARDAEYRDLVLESLIDLVAKNELSVSDIKWVLREGLQFARSHGQIFCSFERELFDRFVNEYKGKELIAFAFCVILLAKNALEDEVSWTESDGGRAYTHWTATLHADDELINYRRHILKTLRDICERETALRSSILEVVFGYSGAYSATSHELFEATAKMIIELFAGFVSMDELDNLGFIAGFRCHCLRHKSEELASELMNRFGASDKDNFLFALIEERHHKKANEHDRCMESAKKLSRDDWRKITKLFSKEGAHSRLGTKMFRFMLRFLSTERDLTVVDWFCDEMLAFGSYPYGGDAIYMSLSRRMGIDGGRRRILEVPSSFTYIWLQNYDEFCLSRNHVASNPCVYFESLKEHGELLSLNEILKIENKHSGFLASYLSAIEDSGKDGRSSLWSVLPYDDALRDSIEPFMDNSEMLAIMKRFALKGFEEDSWVDEKLSMFLFNHDRTFIADLMQVDVNIREGGALKNVALEFWRNCSAEELQSAGELIEEMSHDFKNYFRYREWLRVLTVAAFKQGKAKDVLNWMRSLRCDGSSEYGIWAEIACSLNDDLKIECLTSVCEEDIEKSIFTYIAFSISFEGKSWSGSESSVVLKDIDFARKLKSALKGKKLYKYVLECDEYIDYCEQRLRNIEIEDFINDW